VVAAHQPLVVQRPAMFGMRPELRVKA